MLIRFLHFPFLCAHSSIYIQLYTCMYACMYVFVCTKLFVSCWFVKPKQTVNSTWTTESKELHFKIKMNPHKRVANAGNQESRPSWSQQSPSVISLDSVVDGMSGWQHRWLPGRPVSQWWLSHIPCGFKLSALQSSHLNRLYSNWSRMLQRGNSAGRGHAMS